MKPATPLPFSRRDLLAMAACCALSPSMASAAPNTANLIGLRRGIGVHNLLNWSPYKNTAPGKIEYSWPPFEGPGYQITDAEGKLLRQVGFDFVRLTVDPGIFIVLEGDRRQTLHQRLLQMVTFFLNHDLKVVVDLHPVAANPELRPTTFSSSKDAPAFLAFAELVQRIATLLDPLPHDRVAFELMNEPWIDQPADFPRWQPMLELLHAKARAGSATLPLVLTGANYGDRGALQVLDVRPFKSSRVFYTFHYYDPHTFTHQGFSNDQTKYLFGLQWPVSPDNVSQTLQQALSRIAADRRLPDAEKSAATVQTQKLLLKYLSEGHNARRIQADFADVARWASLYGIANGNIMLGEFDAVVSTMIGRAASDRYDWVNAVRLEAEANGFPWAFWAYKGYKGRGIGGMTLAGEDTASGLDMDPRMLSSLGLKG